MNLSEHSFINSISQERRSAIESEIEVITLEPGDLIFEEGSAPDALYLVLEGLVVFTKRKPDGSRQIISESGEGSFFGEVGVFTGEHRALGAQAHNNVVIGKIPEATVQKIIEDAKPVRTILESVISHLHNTTNHYLQEVMRTEKLTLVGTMVSSILHDFKNPFSIISLGSHLINQRHGDDPQTAKVCRNIDAQIKRMVDMANDLAAYSRGEGEIEVALISLDRLFEFFKELNAPFFKDPHASVTLSANGVSLHGDASKLLRILQNLISNAIDAIHQTNKKGEITVTAYDKGNTVELIVSDNGPGIPKEIQNRFFEPFVTLGKSDGTGLGTAIVKSIIDAHNGSINFDTSDEGTTIKIELPKNP